MSPLKEPQFFASDIFAHQRNVATLPEYLNCFSGANGQKKIGEGSVAYLSSNRAAQEIKAFSPSAQIIIMLRNPVEVMYAQYSQRVFDNMEHVRDFEGAVESNEERKWRSGPFEGQNIMRLGYRELCRFAQPVRRYFDVFGRENVHVVIYEDFRTDTGTAYAEVLRFLQVGPAPEMQYPIINANCRVRSTSAREFLRHPPKRLRGLVRAAFSQNARARAGNFLRRLNTVYETRPPISENLRRRLEVECKPDIEKLSCLLDRDLSHWCEALIDSCSSKRNEYAGPEHSVASSASSTHVSID
jgi:hypothetical protein